jgi:RNA polymerase sigma-70 factor (sigma-E family)
MSTLLPTPTREGHRLPVTPDLRDLYLKHHWDLVRLASLLLHDAGDAEEATQDAFVKAYVAWERLKDPERALAYLRSAVLNGARSRLRHLKVVGRTEDSRLVREESASASAEGGALAADDHRRMIAALRSLPDRQRECLALRYYLDLPESEIAATLGISNGSVKTHIHRGLAALSSRLEATR